MTVGVGALVVRDDGALLIGRRIKRGEPETWCLPGGHVESGESFEAAALREVEEETGIRDVAEPRVFTVVLSGDARVTAGVEIRLTVQTVVAATLEPHVFERWIWARPGELPHPLFPASAAVLAAWRGRPIHPGWSSYAVGRR
ncbi:nucleotide triphosphate diphosphatase NUDT15 [Nonomuraea sp. SBT364]|uniref:nucleotide triphosphate diphosphatase NUDT15 n=1 Tax=Nonomuraea sp. SBT364 TaxID=1580530 RepID=UPI0007C83520|nr:NUDIX domain-containing protein [Nonomuraea sp. SBT364]